MIHRICRKEYKRMNLSKKMSSSSWSIIHFMDINSLLMTQPPQQSTALRYYLGVYYLRAADLESLPSPSQGGELSLRCVFIGGFLATGFGTSSPNARFKNQWSSMICRRIASGISCIKGECIKEIDDNIVRFDGLRAHTRNHHV